MTGLAIPDVDLAGVLLLTLIGVVIWQVPPALYRYVPEPKDRAAAEAGGCWLG
jgi:hypothetical protein